jgi:antibiotic biosynthesis monooxygenase (ABM) superfamily enzyme
MKEDTNVGFVLNHVIAQQDLARFKQLQTKLDQACSGFEGFLFTDLKTISVNSDQDLGYSQFQTQLVFRSVSDLARWLDSPERRNLLDTFGKEIDYSYSFEPVSSGFPSWFKGSKQDLNDKEIPATWKQNLLVILGIYAQLLIQQALLVPLLKNLNFPTSLLVGVVISVYILSWGWMPVLTFLFRGWLYPKNRQLNDKSIRFGLFLTQLSSLSGWLFLRKSLGQQKRKWMDGLGIMAITGGVISCLLLAQWSGIH